MESTSHDLSFNKAEIDLEDLILTATIAFAGKREEINQRMRSLYDLKEPDFRYEATRIKEDAKYLAISAETLYVLQEARNRKIIIIKKKSKVK